MFSKKKSGQKLGNTEIDSRWRPFFFLENTLILWTKWGDQRWNRSEEFFFREHFDFGRKNWKTRSKLFFFTEQPFLKILVSGPRPIFFYVCREILKSLIVCRNKKRLRITVLGGIFLSNSYFRSVFYLALFNFRFSFFFLEQKVWNVSHISIKLKNRNKKL